MIECRCTRGGAEEKVEKPPNFHSTSIRFEKGVTRFSRIGGKERLQVRKGASCSNSSIEGIEKKEKIQQAMRVRKRSIIKRPTPRRLCVLPKP